MARRRPDADFDLAFAELYPTAKGVAMRLLGDRAAAEDAAAEALARAYARWPAVRALPHRQAWVLRVTTNLAIDTLRRRPRGQLLRYPATEDQLLDRLSLARALASLPRRQREVVVLRYLAELSELEVAGALGLAPGSVKSHAHRGLAALRRRLGPEVEEATGATA